MRDSALILCIAVLLLVPRLAARPLPDARWSTDVPISAPETVPRHPVVALSSAGTAYAAWHDARLGPAGGVYVASKLAGDTWAIPVQIPGSAIRNPSAPTIAAGAAGNVYVAWVDGFPDARADVRFAWSVDGGVTWSEVAQVNTDAGDIAGHPDLAVDARGHVHLVWSDLATFGDPHSRDVKWAMRPAGQELWTVPAVVHSEVGLFAEQARPAIAADGAGNVYAVWEDARHGPDDAHAVYAAWLPAGAAQWGLSRRVDHRPGEINARPDIVAAPDGTLQAVWSGGVSGEVLSAVLRPGSDEWEEPVPVGMGEGGKQTGERTPAQADAAAPRIAVDKRGIASVVWQESRSGNSDIYSAVRWPGLVEWETSVRVNDDAGVAAQEAPAVAAGDAGRAVAVWVDHRDGASGTVYAAELHLSIYELRLPLLMRGQ